MNIVVCLRPATDQEERQRCNDPPLRLALGLAGAGHQIIALLPDSAGHVDPLRRALTAGAARAVRLIDDQMSTTDFHGLGQLLANAVRSLEGDLVLLGSPFDDEGVGAMSAALAKILGAVHVARVEGLSPAAAPDSVEITVRGGGRKRRLAVKMPAVLSMVAPPDADVTLPTAAEPPEDLDGAIETLTLSDPEATVVRRRSQHLGRPEIAARETQVVKSAAEFVARLRKK
jgi:electron transfer flavoprotein alpha/beta subunit